MAPWFLLWRPSLVSVCGVKSCVPCSGAATFANVAPQPCFPHGGAEVLFISVAPKPGFPLKSGFRLWRPSLVSCRGARVLFLLSSLSLVSLCGSLVSLCGVAPKSCFLVWRPCLVSFCGASVLRLVRKPGFCLWLRLLLWRLSPVPPAVHEYCSSLRRQSLVPSVAPSSRFPQWHSGRFLVVAPKSCSVL